MVLLGGSVGTWSPDHYLTICVQVRLLRAQLAQGDTVDGVQHPAGGTLENGMQSHLLELQRESEQCGGATLWSGPDCISLCVHQGIPTGRAAS